MRDGRLRFPCGQVLASRRTLLGTAQVRAPQSVGEVLKPATSCEGPRARAEPGLRFLVTRATVCLFVMSPEVTFFQCLTFLSYILTNFPRFLHFL